MRLPDFKIQLGRPTCKVTLGRRGKLSLAYQDPPVRKTTRQAKGSRKRLERMPGAGLLSLMEVDLSKVLFLAHVYGYNDTYHATITKGIVY
jgi:hypothetical protein